MIDKEELLILIRPSFVDLFGNDVCIDLSTQFADLGIDSIKFISLIVKCEEIFGFEIEDDNLVMDKYVSINDYIEMLTAQIKKGRG